MDDWQRKVWQRIERERSWSRRLWRWLTGGAPLWWALLVSMVSAATVYGLVEAAVWRLG